MTMKPKKHQIKTVQDMIDCTNEDNLDNFLIDMRTFLTSAHLLRNMSELIRENKGLPKEIHEIKSKGFTWVEDGKNEAKITIEKAV